MRRVVASILITVFFTGAGLSQKTEIVLFSQRDTLEIGEPCSIKLMTNESIDSLAIMVLDSLNVSRLLSSVDSIVEDVEGADFEIQCNISNESPINCHGQSITINDQVVSGEYYFQLTIWESGHFIIIPNIKAISSDDATHSILNMIQSGHSIHVPQASVPNSLDAQGMAQIEDILVEKLNWTDFLWLLYMAASIIVIFLIYLLYRRWEKLKEEPIVIAKKIMPAHVVAYGRLNEIESRAYEDIEGMKEFQTDLTFAIREYLENRFEIRALEQTTSEIEISLKSISSLKNDQIVEVLNIFSVADIIKFAKGKSSSEIQKDFILRTRDFIDSTKISLDHA